MLNLLISLVDVMVLWEHVCNKYNLLVIVSVLSGVFNLIRTIMQPLLCCVAGAVAVMTGLAV